MVANYYYFLSSLPYLRLGQSPPFTSAEFLEACEYQLAPPAVAQLRAITLIPRPDPEGPVEGAWCAFETALRNHLVRARAQRLGRDAHDELRPQREAFGGLEAQVTEAMNQPHPRRRMELLDALRWRRLDDLAVAHAYDFQSLVVYRLKLLLVEKHAAVDRDAGAAALESFMAAQTENVTIAELANAE